MNTTPMNYDAFLMLANGFNANQLVIEPTENVITMNVDGQNKVILWNGSSVVPLDRSQLNDPHIRKSCQDTLENYRKLGNRFTSQSSASRMPTSATLTGRGRLSAVEVKYRAGGNRFKSTDDQARALASQLLSMNVPQGQKIYIVFATNPVNMEISYRNNGELGSAFGGKQAEMLRELQDHLRGTALEGRVFAAPVPVDGDLQDVNTAITHLDSLLSKGNRVIALKNEDTLSFDQYAYGLSNGRTDSRFNSRVILQIQDGLSKLNNKYAAAGVSAPSGAEGSSASVVQPGAVANFDSKNPSSIQILDDNGQVAKTETSKAKVILDSLIKSGELELATLAEIKNIDPNIKTPISMKILRDYKEGGVVKYKMNGNTHFAGIDDILDNFDYSQKFPCPYNQGKVVLHFDRTKNSAVFVGNHSSQGPCPNGNLYIKFSGNDLAGHQNCGSFELNLRVPSGIQTNAHPNPGTPFTGNSRVFYLPADEDGTKMLAMFLQAWEQRQLFTVGKSITSGQENTMTLNDIHPKTSRGGGVINYGYPDSSYFYRVAEEFNRKGISIDTVKKAKFEDKVGLNDDMKVFGISGEVARRLNNRDTW